MGQALSRQTLSVRIRQSSDWRGTVGLLGPAARSWKDATMVDISPTECFYYFVLKE